MQNQKWQSKKEQILDELKRASDEMTAAGLRILTCVDGELDEDVNVVSLSKLLKAQGMITEIRAEIKLNMKGE